MEAGSNNSPGQHDEDILLYVGQINSSGHALLRGCLAKATTENVCLVLVTSGGDAHVAYKMAKTMRRGRTAVKICVPSLCKSAGTLLCIGANSLVIGDDGELGPLDAQYRKADELWGQMSGLDIIQAISDLRWHTINSFVFFLGQLGGSRPTNQMVEIATDLTRGLIRPIAERIDPIMLGVHNRGIKIAFDYGDRLNAITGTLAHPLALNDLITAYYSHSTVIDRDEARKYFANVTAPDQATCELLAQVESKLDGGFEFNSDNPNPIVAPCSDLISPRE